jgi:DNA-directed RNA polymerase specialized sigma24 family protein
LALLKGRFELHQPGCDHRHCAPDECVRDVEAFCSAILEKFYSGERAAHQPRSFAFLSPADHEEALDNLLEASWKAWLDFRPDDDGRGTNRFGGYLSWILYRRHTDWLRKRFGSTRYGPVPVFTPTADPGQHITEAWFDPEYDDSDGLDLEAAPAGTREALALIGPMIEDDRLSAKTVAERMGVRPPEVARAFRLIRAECRRQGLAPPSAGADDRQTLADRIRDLREQGLSYAAIADELGLRSPQAAGGLLREYHPELTKRRTLGAEAGTRAGARALRSGPMP